MTRQLVGLGNVPCPNGAGFRHGGLSAGGFSRCNGCAWKLASLKGAVAYGSKSMNLIRSTSLIAFSVLAGMTTAHAELLVYEPFDYAPINDEVFGQLAGRNGGLGFSGPWQDCTGRGNDGAAYVYDQRGNPEALYGGSWGGGKPDWDGVVDNLPTMGGYVGMSDWLGVGDSLNSKRKLAMSAGAMAARNRGVLWLSAVWHFPEGSYFAPVGIALTSNDSGFVERATSISDQGNGIGTGNGKKMRDGRMRLNPVIWENGDEVAGAPGANIDPLKDNIVILKFEFGKTDTVSTWYFTEDQKMTERAFNENAISVSSAIDEDTLDTLTFGTIRKGNAVDELRIGTSFKDVISGSIAARQEVKITQRLYDKKSDRYFLKWTSNPGEVYGIYELADAGGFKPCIVAAVDADPTAKETTYGPFANPRKGDARLQFEIGLPDKTQPMLDRAWGTGTTVSLHFSELMHPGPALDTSNYTVAKDGGSRVEIESATFSPRDDTVVLTMAKPLEAAASYTITTNKLTDRANLPLAESTVSFHTWDDNPEGVKVFILAGQSNMVGRGHYDKGQGDEIGGIGSLRAQIQKDPNAYPSLLDGEGNWQPIESMKFWWNRADLGGDPRITKGDLTVGYGAGPDCIGPEYGFGWAIHAHYQDQPVLIIKIAWGGKSLHIDYASPTAAASRDGKIGPYYLQMMDQVHQVLGNMDKQFPEFAGKGYQIAGFGWHQGYNDMLSQVTTEAYEKNMAMFIRDIRAEFGKPKLPFSIATTGHGGMSVTLEQRPTLAGQLAVADPNRYPEFAGNVFTVDTRPFQRSVEESPRSDGSHWNNHGGTLWQIGKGMGDGMVKMLEKE